jgi:hypothetical protein
VRCSILVSLRSLLAVALAFTAAAEAAQASIVTSCTAPATMTRPDDNKLYIFTVDITFTARMGDKPGDQFICDFQIVGGATIDEVTIEYDPKKPIIVGGNYICGFSMEVVFTRWERVGLF